MHESFLHYLWQMQYFDKRDLVTTSGEKVEIFSQGFLNTNAGPDFSNARIKIGAIGWVGTVEIHVNSSQWFEHHHERDRAYDNVILHLVWKHDREILRCDKTILPTLEIRSRVDPSLIRTYQQLISSSFSIPCKKSLSAVSDITRFSMFDKALLQRIERKASDVIALYGQNNNDWEETFYQLLAKSFGFRLNGDPFMQLASLLPLKFLRRHGNNLEQIEALLFGQAGFLDRRKGDSYYLKLKREHGVLALKYSLADKKMSRSQWKFHRLRPANFPPLRLAQFSSLLYRRQAIFSEALEANSYGELVSLFSNTPSPYWLEHYQFGKASGKTTHEFGISSIHNILINTVTPVLAAYGRQHDNQAFVDRAISILQAIPSEENRITKTWKAVGMCARSAFDSQALIELYNNFCRKNSCLNCNIGASLIRPQR
jgi:hypothetical protein